MRMERLIGIMCVLADTQRTTIGALAERFEVSTRTIARSSSCAPTKAAS